MKQKLFLTAAFIVSLIPMVATQFSYDFDSATGLSAILCSPIAIISIIVFLLGIWIPFRNQKINNLIGFFGLLGIILAEVVAFLTWHQTGLNLDQSFSNARGEFYLGLVTSCLTVEIYLCAISCAETSRRATAALRAVRGKGISQSASTPVAKNKAAAVRKAKKAQKKATAKAQKASAKAQKASKASTKKSSRR